MGSVEDPDFAKQNDRDSAARPLAYFPTKLLKQAFDVPPRQAADYGSGEDQLMGALVLPLLSATVLPHGTRCDCLSTAYWKRITLIITRPQPPSQINKRHASGRVHDDVSQAPDAASFMTHSLIASRISRQWRLNSRSTRNQQKHRNQYECDKRTKSLIANNDQAD